MGINAGERETTGKNATCKRIKPKTRKPTQNTNNKNTSRPNQPLKASIYS
ncbi:MAG: hypothetical protein ABSF44_14115 [Candidatus Bathyarchaeia archaeon]